MSKPDTWMAFYVADYLADTLHLTRDQHGAYMLLLMASWVRKGTLPDDDDQLAAITKSTPQEWKKLRSMMAPFFSIQDGCWIQKRLRQEFEKAQKRYQTKVENGSRGGRKPTIPITETITEMEPTGSDSVNRTVTAMQPTGPPNNNRDLIRSGKRTETQPQPQETKNQELPSSQEVTLLDETAVSPTTKKAVRLPENWQLPQQWGEWALHERKDWDEDTVRRAGIEFHDYWVGVPGAKGLNLNWLATWRNNVRRSKMTAGSGNVRHVNGNGGRHGTAADTIGELTGRVPSDAIPSTAKRMG